jgi:hypothetical protein
MKFSPFQWLAMATLSTIIALSTQSCDATYGRGDLVSEDRDEKDFHAIYLDASGDVEVTKDSVFHVEVSCEENIIDDLETEVEDGVLKIYFTRSVVNTDLRVRVSAPGFDAFEVSGSGDIVVKKAISGTKLSVNVDGSGSVDVQDASFDEAKVTISGSGDVILDGMAEHLDVSVSGSGDLDALDFPVKTARVNVSGSGKVLLDVSNFLEAIVSGSGDIEYRGNPTVDKQVSGSGSVRKL